MGLKVCECDLGERDDPREVDSRRSGKSSVSVSEKLRCVSLCMSQV